MDVHLLEIHTAIDLSQENENWEGSEEEKEDVYEHTRWGHKSQQKFVSGE